MKTEFSKRQLRNDNIQMANDIFRRCVHCGICTATCSSYVVVGDERDSPRGRIYMIKEMLESATVPDKNITRHMDRCLSCFSCMTTCPSGVDYMHLSDLARVEIEKRGARTFSDRTMRNMLSAMLPYPKRFGLALKMGRLFRPVGPILENLGFKEMAAMLELLPPKSKSSPEFKGGGVARPKGQLHKRVVLMTGCAQQVIRPSINDASIRLMARQGIEVIVPEKAGCCGALDLHLGKEDRAKAHARRNIRAFKELEMESPIDSIIINASGCGTTVKDYGHLFGSHSSGSAKKSANQSDMDDAVLYASKALDISEFLINYNFGSAQQWSNLKVAVHIPCSMKHGQKIDFQPMQLLQNAGFSVLTLDEAHICCGSAGVYNVLQPEIANSLGQRKAEHIKNAKADIVATGNLGCLTQMNHHAGVPVVHFVELLDWAYGGPCPEGVEHLQDRVDSLSLEH